MLKSFLLFKLFKKQEFIFFLNTDSFLPLDSLEKQVLPLLGKLRKPSLRKKIVLSLVASITVGQNPQNILNWKFQKSREVKNK